LSRYAPFLVRSFWTDSSYVKAYLTRIEQVNEVVKAVTAITPDVIETAKKCDSERALGTLRGRLHGIPILVKDVFLTTDGTDTTGMPEFCLLAR
jgi:amidase